MSTLEVILRFEAAARALGNCRQDLPTREQQLAYDQMLSYFCELWRMVEQNLPMTQEETAYAFHPADYFYGAWEGASE